MPICIIFNEAVHQAVRPFN